jgi:hypothetical protein
MMKKILSILLISLLALGSIGSACAGHDYYTYNCKLGDEFSTVQLMHDIDDPIWISYDELNYAMTKFTVVHFTGKSGEQPCGSWIYSGYRVGSEQVEIPHNILASDFLTINVNPR